MVGQQGEPESEMMGGLELNTVEVSYDTLRGLGVPDSVCTKMKEMGVLLSMTQDQASSKEVAFGLDSGAAVTIAPVGTAPGYPLEDTATGVVYKAANGGSVPDLGRKRLKGWNEAGVKFGVKTRIGPVRRPLMSVCELCDNGQEVTFKKSEAVITKAGKVVMRVPRVGKLWQLNMKLEDPPRPGRQAE